MESSVAGSAEMSADPAVRFVHVTKRYGAITACDDITLDLHRGSVHGILGENGAGKSTLMKMLIGLVRPDEGRIEINGDATPLRSPTEAAERGIGMVHQHFSLVEALTVWENLVLGEAGRLDRQRARRLVGDIGDRYGLDVDPDARVGNLSAGLRQRVEILKCLRRDPSIVVFDEPTSVLTPAESEQLFSVLRVAVTREGKAVALVSHKLDEILAATDTVSILRRGALVASSVTAATDAAALARDMVGRPVSLRTAAAALGLVETLGSDDAVTDRSVEEGPVVLSLEGLVVEGAAGERRLDGLDLTVRAGEIVGLAGVEGNGQHELVDVLSSLRPLASGSVRVGETLVPAGRAGAMGDAGVGVIPEDRHDSGCLLELSVAENLALARPHASMTHGLLDRSAMRARATALIDRYGIVCAGPDAPLWSLSGGNQQRVVLARELDQRPTVLVAAQPTRGLDVGAIEFMNERLAAAAADGIGVLLISSELEEILHLSHRIAVIHRGRILGEMDRTSVDVDRIGLMMGGGQQ